MSIPGIIREKTCCFSGYRPHKFRFKFAPTNKNYTALESDILNAILQSYNDGYNTFLCGGAMGFDLLCGETVLLVKKRFPDIRLIFVLPFEGQELSFPKEWQERYNRLLTQCDLIDYVSKEYVQGCYFVRNEKMVDNSSRIITYFDGRIGGTARTIAYAQLNKLDVLNISKANDLPEQITFFTGHK